MPTKSPGLMSLTDALAMPATLKPGLSVTAASGPSRVFTVSVDPSRLTIAPRTWTLSAAHAEDGTEIATIAATPIEPARVRVNFCCIASTPHDEFAKPPVAAPAEANAPRAEASGVV